MRTRRASGTAPPLPGGGAGGNSSSSSNINSSSAGRRAKGRRSLADVGFGYASTSSAASSNSSNSSSSGALISDPESAAWRAALALSYDGWILDAQLLPGLGYAGALAPPSQLLEPPAAFVELQRATPPQLRLYGTSYEYRTAALPLGRNGLVLYGSRAAVAALYRDPAMRRRLGLGLDSASNGTTGTGAGGDVSGSDVSLPLVWSWEQLVDAAAALNGTDVDGDGAAEYGICLAAGPGCLGPALVQAIAASYLQTYGPSQGWLLDTRRMVWRIDSAGFRAALWTLQRLLSYGPPELGGDGSGGAGANRWQPPACRRMNVAFAEGRCAFTIHTLSHVKVWCGCAEVWGAWWKLCACARA